MTDEQPKLDPEQESPEGEQQQDDVEDLALDAADAEEVKGGGWPNAVRLHRWGRRAARSEPSRDGDSPTQLLTRRGGSAGRRGPAAVGVR